MGRKSRAVLVGLLILTILAALLGIVRAREIAMRREQLARKVGWLEEASTRRRSELSKARLVFERQRLGYGEHWLSPTAEAELREIEDLFAEEGLIDDLLKRVRSMLASGEQVSEIERLLEQAGSEVYAYREIIPTILRYEGGREESYLPPEEKTAKADKHVECAREEVETSSKFVVEETAKELFDPSVLKHNPEAVLNEARGFLSQAERALPTDRVKAYDYADLSIEKALYSRALIQEAKGEREEAEGLIEEAEKKIASAKLFVWPLGIQELSLAESKLKLAKQDLEKGRIHRAWDEAYDAWMSACSAKYATHEGWENQYYGIAPDGSCTWLGPCWDEWGMFYDGGTDYYGFGYDDGYDKGKKIQPPPPGQCRPP